MKFPKFSKLQIILAAVILISAVFLRLVNLDSLPVFADEAIYVRWAQVMRAEPTLRFVPLSDGKQPLYMWVVIPFQKLITDPVVAGRIVSALTGVGTLLGVGVLTFILFRSRNVALVASAFYALSPYTVFYDRVALVDSMLSMFGVWFLVFSLLAVIHKRMDWSMIAGFALGGALLTKSPGLFFVILLPTTILFFQFPKNQNKRLIELTKVGLRWGATLSIGYGFYNILRLGPNFHMIARRNQDYVYPFTHVFDTPLDPFIPYFHRNFQFFLILGGVVLVFLFVIGVINLRKRWKQIVLLLAWLLIPIIAVSEYSKTMTPRYIYFTVPYFIVIAGSSYILFKGKLEKVFMLIMAGFVVASLYKNYQIIVNTEDAKLPTTVRSGFLEEWTSGTGIRESSEIIRQQYLSDPSKKIVVGTEGFFGTLPDAMQAYLNDIPEITVIGLGVNFGEVPDGLVESFRSGNKTYFIVNESRLNVNPTELGLVVLKSFDKAERSEGTMEHSWNGPQDRLFLMELTEVAPLPVENQ
ncbi:ArnT family glycosyltransferase [Patescibacteria group bacterium]